MLGEHLWGCSKRQTTKYKNKMPRLQYGRFPINHLVTAVSLALTSPSLVVPQEERSGGGSILSFVREGSSALRSRR